MWILQTFGGQERVPEDATVLGDGQKLLMEVAQRGQQRQFTISNIWSWLQAYSRYMAVTYGLQKPCSRKKQQVYVSANMNMTLQLSRDLGGNQCLRYDQQLGNRLLLRDHKMGELDLAIYGRCLSL